jgi:hypothetical protein
MTDLKCIEGGSGGPLATVEQLAAIEFKAVPQFAAMSKKDRAAKLRAMANRVYHAAQIALEVNATDKDENIRLARENYDSFKGSLDDFELAVEGAQAMLDLIKSAECKIIVALAALDCETDIPAA